MRDSNEQSMDLTFLNKALIRLQEGLDRYLQNKSDTQIRDGLIQRFEFSYELSYKTLKRFLMITGENTSQYDSIAFPDLIRVANQKGLLLNDWSSWKLYREMRNQTSHAYDEAIALEVVAHIDTFLQEACYLRDRLQERLEKH